MTQTISAEQALEEKWFIEPHSLSTRDWIGLILRLTRRLHNELEFFYMLRPMDHVCNGGRCGQKKDPEWSYSPYPFSSKDLVETLDKAEGWPEKITSGTKMVSLFEYMNGFNLGYLGCIILTEEAQLFEWKWFGKSVNSGQAIIEHSTLDPFTTERMEKAFARGSFMPHMIYRNLCFLTRLQATWMEEHTSGIQKLATELELRCEFISPEFISPG